MFTAITIAAVLGAFIGAFLHKAYVSYQQARNMQWFNNADQKAYSTSWRRQWFKSLISL